MVGHMNISCVSGIVAFFLPFIFLHSCGHYDITALILEEL